VTLYAVGRVVKAFGIKGEIIVRPLTSSPDRFRRLRSVLVGKNEATTVPAKIDLAYIGQRGVRLKLATTSTRTEAEKLVGAFLFVDRRDRLRPSRGTYYVDQVMGLTVIDESGGHVGTVTDVMKLPAQDVYVVRTGEREIMIPAVREFIRKIDIGSGTMKVRLIDGMMEG
jgi:16S rRNA processing protein RimM